MEKISALKQIPTDHDWIWLDLQDHEGDSPGIEQLRRDHPDTRTWLDIISKQETNYLTVRFPDGREPVLFGSLLYTNSEEMQEKDSCLLLHFYVNKDKLITINLDGETRRHLEQQGHLNMLKSAPLAAEGLLVIIRMLMHYLHSGMDQFEKKLREVEETMQKNNHKYLLDQIISARFELLYWSNLFVPCREIATAVKEAYLKEIEESPIYLRFLYRGNRMQELVEHYEKEMDTLISIDDAVTAFRGNDIMKTLTIVTSVFTPATVIGALWGMNFKRLPWDDLGSFGFALMCGIILLLSGGMYFWIRAKGWTGDLLKAKRKNENV